MSVSIDKEGGDGGESPRAVLSGWLDDYSAGRCDRADMQTSFLDICKSNSEAPWDALALLDQYQRRGRIDVALARSLKSDIAQLVFGASNQSEGAREPVPRLANASNTTGSGWRKQSASERSAAPREADAISDPTLFRRDFDPPTRPPPRVDVPAARRSPAQAVAVPTSPASDAQAGSTSTGSVLRDRYELLEIIGRGTVGTAYKAFDRHRRHLPGPARFVAVKVLKSRYKNQPAAIAELERESYEAQSISHPNVVSVFDLDKHGDTFFIVMELLDGELLSSVLRWLDDRPLARSRALNIIGTIGGALAHAHQRNIVHADLKPSNVMITNSGELKLLDFGFARRHDLDPWIADSASEEVSPSATTPAYASSERVNGEEPHPGDDVYSLACIAYELLSGVHPFGGRSAPLARAHGRDPARIPGLTNKQWYALQNALCWSRADRRIDVVGLTAALGCPSPVQRIGSPQELIAVAGKSGGGSRVWAVLGVIAVLAVLAAVAWWHFGNLNNLGDFILPKLGFVSARVESPAPDHVTGEAAPVAREAPVESGIRESDFPGDALPAPPEAVVQVPAVPGSSASKAAAAAAEESADSTAGGPIGTVEFDKDTFVATESDGTVRLSVKRTGSIRRSAKFRWTLHSNSAEAGADFAALGPDIEEIPAGVRTAVLTIPLVNDGLVENTELFLVELSQVEGGPQIGEQARAAVIIVDDD